METNHTEKRIETVFPIGRDMEEKERAEAARAAAKRLTDVVQPAVGRVVGGIRSGANVLQGAVKSGVGAASDKLVDRQDQLLADGRELICAHPAAAVGVAFGFGLLLSMALTKR
jgi:hypothetical protein